MFRAKRGRAPHGVDVAQGVGDGDGPVAEWVVDDGREEVHREYQGLMVPDAVHSGVVLRLGPHQQVGVGHHGQLAQDLNQVLRTELGGSTGAVCQGG